MAGKEDRPARTVAVVNSDRLSGGALKACSASHIVAEKTNKEKDAVAAAKSKAEDSKAAAADESVEAAAGDGKEEDDSEIKWVEMTEGYLRWILAQKRENYTVPPIEDYMTTEGDDACSTVFSQKNIDEARKIFARLHASMQASHDDFFEYQAWVREEYEKNGRVLIPEPWDRDELQKEINDAWVQFEEDYGRYHPDGLDIQSEEELKADWGSSGLMRRCAAGQMMAEEVLVSEACSEDELQKEIDDVWTQFEKQYGSYQPDDLDIESKEELKADCVPGSFMRPCAGGKKKATDADLEAASHSSDGGEAAAHATMDVASKDMDDDDKEEWVEMPEDYLCWILSQTMETDPVPSLDDYSLRRRADPEELARISQRIGRFQAMQDEFFEFQAWVSETFEKNGCVMVPPSFASPQLQEEMNELWDKLMEEYDDAELDTKEGTLVALPTN